MQLSNGEKSEECDVLILEEKSTGILPSSSTVDQDGVEIFKKTNDNAKFRNNTNFKRKESSSDEKSTSKNKIPRDSRHGGVECMDVPKEKVNENIMTALSAKPSYMCYECGKVLENKDLLRVHLLNHSNKISKHRDLENGSNHRDLENGVADPQLTVSKTLTQQDSSFPPNSNMSMLVPSDSAAGCTVLGEDSFINPWESSGNFVSFLMIGSGQKILDPKHTVPFKSSSPVDSLVIPKGKRTLEKKHSNSKAAAKPYKCQICGKIFKLHGNFMRHIEKVHGQHGFKTKCNSSGSEISENASKCAGDLVSSEVDCGQVVSNTQRKEAAGNKSSHLFSNFTKDVSGTVEKSIEEVASRNTMDCSSASLPMCRNMNTLQNSSTASSENVSATTNWLLPVQDNNSKSPYSCPICFKKLSKDYVKIHLRLHQDKPYSCELCEKSYVTQSKLNRHIKKTHMPKEKSLDGSSIKSAQKMGIAVEVSESKRDECNVQVDDGNVCPKTDINLVGNEPRENVHSRTVEKCNKDLGNTSVEYKENMSIDSVKETNYPQAGSFLGKSNPLNNLNSFNVPERCSDVEITNSLDSDVIVIETDLTKNAQNDEIRENREKGLRTLPQTSVPHIVTID